MSETRLDVLAMRDELRAAIKTLDASLQMSASPEEQAALDLAGRMLSAKLDILEPWAEVAEAVEGLKRQVEMGDLQLRQSVLNETGSRNKGWTFLANQLANTEQRIAALEAARPAHTAGRVDSHAEALSGLAERVEKLEERQEKSVQTLALQGEARHALYERVVQLEANNIKRGQEIVDQAERITALEESANCLIRDAGLERAARQSDGLEHEQRITALENKLADLAERQDSQGQYIANLQTAHTLLLERCARQEGKLDALTDRMRMLAERQERVEADNASLRADLDAANRRWDAWAQIVQPDMLKVSQLDTERRLAEVETECQRLEQRADHWRILLTDVSNEARPDCDLCGGTGMIHTLKAGPGPSANWSSTVCDGCKGTGKNIERRVEGQG